MAAEAASPYDLGMVEQSNLRAEASIAAIHGDLVRDYGSYLRTYARLPRVENPPARMWRDWVFFGALGCGAVAELVFRTDLPTQPFPFLLTLALIHTVLFRRTHAFAAATITLISYNVVEAVSLVLNDRQSLDIYTSAFVLVLVYCVYRWASGREGLLFAGLLVIAWTLSFFSVENTLGEVFGGAVFLMFPILLGLEFRFLQQWRAAQLERVKEAEREMIARELHDTVAHHVSAIAIQAQAGLAASKSSPEAATKALQTVEEQAAQTLTEMRTMVGTLRGGPAELAPRAGIRDIESLNRQVRGPALSVHLAGDVDDLRPSVDAALYRLAQESITNASRHARNVTEVVVEINAGDDNVVMTVSDDGDRINAGDVASGYGLLGMAERAKLLGGSLTAGPGPQRGWNVNATIPRQART